MSEFVTVADVNDVPPGSDPIVVEINRRWIAVYNVEGTLYAIEDVCTHDGGPLAEGTREGCIVECPRHGAKFDLRNGEALIGPAGTTDTPTYEVRIDGGSIMIGPRKPT
jgi:3-phenylpropionate/trans-cinnamate dioxygenase ferredoxin component